MHAAMGMAADGIADNSPNLRKLNVSSVKTVQCAPPAKWLPDRVTVACIEPAAVCAHSQARDSGILRA